jgi:hypothetical protein
MINCHNFTCFSNLFFFLTQSISFQRPNFLAETAEKSWHDKSWQYEVDPNFIRVQSGRWLKEAGLNLHYSGRLGYNNGFQLIKETVPWKCLGYLCSVWWKDNSLDQSEGDKFFLSERYGIINSSRCSLKTNSRTYNFVEVSGQSKEENFYDFVQITAKNSVSGVFL